MKLSKFALASLISVIFSVGAQAADSHNGSVTFKGKIIDTPCSVSPEDLHQTIDFGEISKTVLENGGTSEIKPFDITLKDCSLDTATSAKIVFSGGVASGTNNELLALNGSASGAGIAVERVGEKIKFDGTTLAVAATPLSNGDNIFSFTSYVEKLPTPEAGQAPVVTTGSFSSTANFVVSYQ
ncbi:type 1 fimbrial protein [Pectobacterium polonicum]|uniref:Type 1 fimbrial protein n=1 Tax=Pectobacterium polonicum TaxID=2485124 RepID=A0AAE9NU11_9GAMM|nr:fimbrial protein [Pectobacterium polonicum]UVO09242.1 type 1 fimbrial protein [Pectobacterium polonicum]